MPDCHARRQSDEMHCPVCRLRWDVNDPEPPACARLTPSGVPIVEAPSIAPGRSAEPVVVATRGANERLPFVSALAPDIFVPAKQKSDK